jgi:hypothetical protein
MTKMLKIESCRECPFHYRPQLIHIDFQELIPTVVYCTHKKFKKDGDMFASFRKRIYFHNNPVNPFPEWCPLEDKPGINGGWRFYRNAEGIGIWSKERS